VIDLKLAGATGIPLPLDYPFFALNLYCILHIFYQRRCKYTQDLLFVGYG
jgi:hypothetical protein